MRLGSLLSSVLRPPAAGAQPLLLRRRLCGPPPRHLPMVAARSEHDCSHDSLATLSTREGSGVESGGLVDSSGVRAPGQKPPQAQLDALFLTAKAALSRQRTLTAAQVEELCALSKAVPLEELGINSMSVQEPQSFVAELSQSSRQHPMLKGKVSYMHIYEDGDLTLGVFLLPAGACIPLHNHPGMTVVSRLLFGSLHIKAYDLLSEAPKAEDSQEELQRGRSLLHSSSSSSNSSANSRQWGHKVGQRHKAQLRMDRVVTAPEQDVMVLYPTSCNLHEFRAVTPCAVLDLLTPPYEPQNGRDCTYYQVVPSSDSRGQPPQPAMDPKGTRTVDLEEYEALEFTCERAHYGGNPVGPAP